MSFRIFIYQLQQLLVSFILIYELFGIVVKIFFSILVTVSGVSTVISVDQVQIPKGEMWSVHKFGGTCVGNSQRIRNVAEVIINDNSERKLVVVSAMSKVTDMMYDLIRKAQSRDDSYLSALEAVLEKHRLTARDLLDGDDLASFLSHLHNDISNLKAMLRAIYIGSVIVFLFTFNLISEEGTDIFHLQLAMHQSRFQILLQDMENFGLLRCYHMLSERFE